VVYVSFIFAEISRHVGSKADDIMLIKHNATFMGVGGEGNGGP